MVQQFIHILFKTKRRQDKGELEYVVTTQKLEGKRGSERPNKMVLDR